MQCNFNLVQTHSINSYLYTNSHRERKWKGKAGRKYTQTLTAVTRGGGTTDKFRIWKKV